MGSVGLDFENLQKLPFFSRVPAKRIYPPDPSLTFLNLSASAEILTGVIWHTKKQLPKKLAHLVKALD